MGYDITEVLSMTAFEVRAAIITASAFRHPRARYFVTDSTAFGLLLSVQQVNLFNRQQ